MFSNLLNPIIHLYRISDQNRSTAMFNMVYRQVSVPRFACVHHVARFRMCRIRSRAPHGRGRHRRRKESIFLPLSRLFGNAETEILLLLPILHSGGNNILLRLLPTNCKAQFNQIGCTGLVLALQIGAPMTFTLNKLEWVQ